MPSLFKWLLFIGLCGGYVWMVFFGFTKTEELTVFEPLNLDEVPDPPENYKPAESDTTPAEWNSADYDSMSDEQWETPNEEPSATEEIQPGVPSSEKPYALIYGSYLDEERAQTAVEYLGFDCPSCEVVFVDPYYKLVLQRSSSKEEAKELQRHYKELGASGFIQKL